MILRTIDTPKGLVQLREATPDDAAAYREMRLEGLKHHPEAFGSDYEQSLTQPVEQFRERLVNIPHRVTFVAEADRQLIGMVTIIRETNRKLEHAATIVAVYLRPGWRGLHLMDAMIEACLDRAREYQVRLVRLAVAVTNTPAIRCYLRCGFSVYGVEPESIFTGGKYYDELLMMRRLV